MVARNEAGREVALLKLGGTVQTISVSGSSAAITNAVAVPSGLQAGPAPGHRIIELISTTDCHIAVGIAPTATTAGHFIKANIPYRYTIKGGYKVAAIQTSGGSAGTLYVIENG